MTPLRVIEILEGLIHTNIRLRFGSNNRAVIDCDRIDGNVDEVREGILFLADFLPLGPTTYSRIQIRVADADIIQIDELDFRHETINTWTF